MLRRRHLDDNWCSLHALPRFPPLLRRLACPTPKPLHQRRGARSLGVGTSVRLLTHPQWVRGLVPTARCVQAAWTV